MVSRSLRRYCQRTKGEVSMVQGQDWLTLTGFGPPAFISRRDLIRHLDRPPHLPTAPPRPPAPRGVFPPPPPWPAIPNISAVCRFDFSRMLAMPASATIFS